jgi:hypothetical protein
VGGKKREFRLANALFISGWSLFMCGAHSLGGFSLGKPALFGIFSFFPFFLFCFASSAKPPQTTFLF